VGQLFAAGAPEKRPQPLTRVIDGTQRRLQIDFIVFFPSDQGLLQQGFTVIEMPVKTALGNTHAPCKGLDRNRPNALFRYQYQGLLFPIARAECRSFFLF
jgi:hypothetical protein